MSCSGHRTSQIRTNKYRPSMTRMVLLGCIADDENVTIKM